MTKSVLLSYDVITTSPTRGLINQLPIAEVFAKLLNELPITLHTQIPEFEQTHLYALCDLSLTNADYHYLPETLLTTKAKDYLRQTLAPYDLFIGLELSRETRSILASLNINYIDLWVSPLRFYKDIIFEFSSNAPEIQKRLQGFALNESLLIKQVASLKQHSKQFFPSPLLHANSVLLVGQMMQDKSLMQGGRFLNLLDFQDRIERLSEQYDHIYLLKHPYLKDDDFAPIRKELLKIRNLSILTNINTYQLLLQPEITLVAGISSSVLSEALYFGKSVEFFYRAVTDETYCRVFKHYFNTTFWASLINLDAQPNQVDEITYHAEDNFFRLKYRMSYSYDIFMPNGHSVKSDTRQKYDTVVSIFKFIEQLDRSQHYVLYGFGSVGKLLMPHIKEHVVAIIDKGIGKRTDSNVDVPFISAEELSDYPEAKIIVSAFLYNQEISAELMNINNDVILIEEF